MKSEKNNNEVTKKLIDVVVFSNFLKIPKDYFGKKNDCIIGINSLKIFNK